MATTNTVTVSTIAARAAYMALIEAESNARNDAKRAVGFDDIQRKHEARADAFKRAADEIKNTLNS